MLLSLVTLSHRVGFFGQPGILWAFIGFVCLIIVVAILFKIMRLVLAAFGVGEPWVSIIYWSAVLILFIFFIDKAFGFNW